MFYKIFVEISYCTNTFYVDCVCVYNDKSRLMQLSASADLDSAQFKFLSSIIFSKCTKTNKNYVALYCIDNSIKYFLSYYLLSSTLSIVAYY